jgi:hypothetical protein
VSTDGYPTYRLAQHLAGLLSYYTAHSPYDVRNSIEFVCILGALRVDNRDKMVRFDEVSLFTRVPIKDTMYLLGLHFEEDILKLFRHVLAISYLRFNASSTDKLMV